MRYVSTVCLLFAVIIQCKAQKVKPALNLTKGNTYYMVSTATSSVSQSLGGRQNKIGLTLSFKMAFKVTAAMDSVYIMEASYQSLNMIIQTPSGMIEMDSRKKDSLDLASSIVRAMMNKPFYVTLTKRGKVLSVDKVENMIEGVFDSFPDIDAAKKVQMKTQFIQTFGAKAFKGNLEIGTAIFPAVPVIKNDSWVVTTSLESVATAKMRTIYQLIDFTKEYYELHGEGTITTDNNASATMMNGLPVKYNLTGTMLSDIKADKTTGWISELRIKQLINGNIEVQDNPKIPGGMIVPMIISTDQLTSGSSNP